MPSDLGVSSSTSVIGALIVVALIATSIIALGLPERLACGIETGVTSITGDGTPECEEVATTTTAGPTVDLLATEDTTDQDRTDPFAPGGLTAKTFSTNDSVASPAIRDANAATVVSASDARCALAPDRGTWDSKICLIADSQDPATAADGSQLLVRCATTVTEPTTGTCFPTSDDDVRGGRTAISTATRDGQTRFCQPLRAERIDPREDNSPFRVDWACASWAGNLYHCTNTLSPDIITTARSNGLVNYTEPTTWTTDPDYRNTWPDTCDSRTFPAGFLACTPDKATNLAACDIRAFHGLPLRPATCAYFHPRTGEDAGRTHTLDKPMHCTLFPVTDGPTAGPPTPCGTTSPHQRRALKGGSISVREAACQPPVDLSEAAPRIYVYDRRMAPRLITEGHFEPGVRPLASSSQHWGAMSFINRWVSFATDVTQALPGSDYRLPTVIVAATHDPGDRDHPGPRIPHYLGNISGDSALIVSDEDDLRRYRTYRDVVDHLVRAYGLRDHAGEPGLTAGLVNALSHAAANVQPSTNTTATYNPRLGDARLWVLSVYGQLVKHASPATASAVMIHAVQHSGGTAGGFAAALLPAINELSQVLVPGMGTVQTPTGPWDVEGMNNAVLEMAEHPSWPTPTSTTGPGWPSSLPSSAQATNPQQVCSVTGACSTTGSVPRPTLTLRP